MMWYDGLNGSCIRGIRDKTHVAVFIGKMFFPWNGVNSETRLGQRSSWGNCHFWLRNSQVWNIQLHKATESNAAMAVFFNSFLQSDWDRGENGGWKKQVSSNPLGSLLGLCGSARLLGDISMIHWIWSPTSSWPREKGKTCGSVPTRNM